MLQAQLLFFSFPRRCNNEIAAWKKICVSNNFNLLLITEHKYSRKSALRYYFFLRRGKQPPPPNVYLSDSNTWYTSLVKNTFIFYPEYLFEQMVSKVIIIIIRIIHNTYSNTMFSKIYSEYYFFTIFYRLN